MNGDYKFNRCWKVTAWHESIPTDPTNFRVDRKTLDVVEITDLRVQFRVSHSLKKNPNTCDVIITNLSPASRKEVDVRPLAVQLEAGYDGLTNFLFVGDVRYSISELKGCDWETLLQLGDDDCHHRWARVSRSYRPGTSYRQVLTDVAHSFGYSLPAELASNPDLDRQFVAGTTTHGPTRDVLTRLLAPFGYDWSVQSGSLKLLRPTDTTNKTAIVISEDDTAMIGTPQFGSPSRSGKPPHMTVKMLLNPDITAGGSVYLKSRARTGFFRAERVDHHGDSHGNGEDSWTTSVELKPLS